MGKAMGSEKDPELEGDEKDIETAWDDEIQEWEDAEKFENTTLKISVYRQPLRGGEREKVWEFTDEIVSTHEIGKRFGGGRYSTYGRIVQDGKVVKTIRRTFRLSESSYAPPQAAPQQMAGVAMPPPMNLENILRMIQAAIPVAVALKDLFGGNGATKLAAMEDAQKVVGRVIEESARREIAMIKTVRSEIMNGEAKPAAKADEVEGTEQEFKAYLLDVLKEYGPGLIEAIGLKLTTAKAVLKRDPVFKTLAQNEGLFARVHGLLLNDPELGDGDKAMIEKVLTKISEMGVGINIPPRPANVNGARVHA